MEEVWANPANRTDDKVGAQELSWKYLGTPQRMARWQMLLDEAASLAKTDRARNNLALFDKAIWSYMKAGFDAYTKRMAYPIPSATIPKVAEAGGNFAKVDWAKASSPVQSWSRQNSAQPARRALRLLAAHDGQYLYLKLTDPCGDVSRLSDAHPGDTLELFVANRRAIPFRQFIAFSGNKKKFQAILQGEVNWRMNVPLTDHHIKYDVDCPDAKTEEMLLAMPLDELAPGGKPLKAGDTFFMNAVRVTPPALTHPDDRAGWGYSVSTLAPFCGLREVDRLAELTLGK
jgi:hypothetical protein